MGEAEAQIWSGRRGQGEVRGGEREVEEWIRLVAAGWGRGVGVDVGRWGVSFPPRVGT